MADPNMSVNVNYSAMPADYVPPKPKKDLGTVADAIKKLDAMKGVYKTDEGGDKAYWSKKRNVNVGGILYEGNKTTVFRNSPKGYGHGPRYFECVDVDGDKKFDACETRDSKDFITTIETQSGRYRFDKLTKSLGEDATYDVMQNLLNNIPDKRADVFKVE